MSVDVLREVFRLSQSKGVARNVLTVLADAAHPDGVTWLPVAPSKNGDPTKCITHRANASRRAVFDAIDALTAAGEVEVRQAQRGRARFNVYRVTLGSVGASAVDYADLPFELDSPFSDGVQILHLVAGDDRVQISGDGVQFSSRRGADFVTPVRPDSPEDAGTLPPRPVPEASLEPSIDPSAAEPKTSTLVSQRAGKVGDPAAEQPPHTAEVRDVVLSFANADNGSPKIVLRELGNLPASVFRDAVERARARRGGVGLLIDFIRIARHERAAMFSAQLAVELGQPSRVVPRPIMTPDALLGDDPKRYARIMASSTTFTRDLMAARVDGRADADVLLAEFDGVRAGSRPRDQVGTAEQELERWIRTNPGHPDTGRVIDGCDLVDPVFRQEMHELAEQSAGEATSTREAAA